MPRKTPQHTVTEDEAGRADRVVQAMSGLTRAKVRGLFDHGCVQVNGTVCTQDFHRVAAGDTVRLDYDPANPRAAKAKPWKDSAFRIVHEDAHLIVVDKAAWVLTVPRDEEANAGTATVVSAVGEYLRHQRGKGREPIVVQRLDRGTSGLLVLAKTSEAAQGLRDQFAAHLPRREYLALVAGIVEKDRGTYDTNINTAPNLTRFSTPRRDVGERAVTHYAVERRYPKHGVTLVRCRLETGQRNQVRVHFADAGHPVLGDKRYRPKRAAHPNWPGRGTLALHAAVLSFTHPVTGKAMRFTSPLPDTFKRVVR